MMRRNILILISSLCLIACHNRTMYNNFQPVPMTGWNEDSILRFDIPVSDTTHTYNVLLHIRHTDAYPYQNMWLFIGENTVHYDTIEFYLANDRGQWLGNGQSVLEMPVLYRENLRFTDTLYTLTVQQGMRNELLPGVSDIGVEITRTQTK